MLSWHQELHGIMLVYVVHVKTQDSQVLNN